MRTAASAYPVLSSLSPSTGQQGQKITLHGQNFGSRKGKIFFGSTELAENEITSWTDTSVNTTVPEGRNQVDVQLMTRGEQKSNSLKFTYDSNNTGSDTEFLSNFKVLASNDLGMHCVDDDFSVFSILPPFNTINAQVVGQNANGLPRLLGDGDVILRYSPVADTAGSINSTSIGKTNFWDHVSDLFGAALTEGQGIKNLYMPADAPNKTNTTFSWNNHLGMHSAEGVPIFPVDDLGAHNPYPMLLITAYDANDPTRKLAETSVVVPVSDETTCSNCHATGGIAARKADIPWSNNDNLSAQSRANILLLHDSYHPQENLTSKQPILCASCHYSPALDLAGNGKPTGLQEGHKWMSQVMHDFHKDKMTIPGKTIYDSPAPVGDTVNVPPAAEQACYQCHPGADTKCLRGAMTETVTCQNCHGDMEAVGGSNPLLAYGPIVQTGAIDKQTRKAWSDEPRCQSCHTGDAVNHMTPAGADLAADGIRLMHAFDRNDASAAPFLAVNKRFAENDDKLFRFSKGHGGVACEGCHGSTHAIWPGDSDHPNDDVAAETLQGHAGTIGECNVCHGPGSLPLTLKGPHGMHNVGDTRWAFDEDRGHPAFYKQSPAECKACHGADLTGTVLSKAATDRSWQTEWGTKTVKKGRPVGCYTCHNGPDDD
ncbi:IPT/TIG domain-containing protein [Methylomonas sp. MgM2]